MDNIPKNILATVIYYDLFDYPLTAFEIWKYLIRSENQGVRSGRNEEKCSLEDVFGSLENEKLKKYIEEYRGFYFLKNRKDLVGQRIERNKISEAKFKIIKKVVFWLRLAPFVRMIAVTGTVAMKNAVAKSDLDFLVVLKGGRIFIGRTLATLLVHLLGRRRYGDKIANRVCLNYFITTKSLEIELKDIFSAHEYTFMYPLYGGGNFRKFQEANGWIEKYMLNFVADETLGLKLIKDSGFSKAVRKIGEIIFNFDFLERWLGGWQTERIARDPRTHKDGSIIMADESSLVFLPEPQSPEIKRRFLEKLEKVCGNA